ncbi:HEAT repeat domain-containing protein [Bremerella cremea]|uniref:HEAT repeat domain-containing protein n=1 Tax=Bremerella cremea TaxID=1031537 RepID=UPI0031EFDDCB
MPSGIEKTFQLLANTDNHAVVPVLVDALDSPYTDVREAALSALLEQRHAVAQRALVQRWRNFTPVQRSWIELSGISLEIALRELIQSNDNEQFTLALEILDQVPEFELIPALALIVRDSGHAFRDPAGNTLVNLAANLRKKLRDDGTQANVESVRSRAIDSLGDCIRHYEQHESLPILEAFLVLVTRENQLLREAWNNPRHPAHAAIIRFLRHSSRPEIIELVLSSLTDMHPASPVLNIIGLRHDPAFIAELTTRAQGSMNDTIRRNLSRLSKVAWAEEHSRVLDKLNGLQQAAAVHMSMSTSIGSDRLYDLLIIMAHSSHASGRLAALEELASYVDPKTNELILEAVSDPNSAVRAEALRQLRPRGIPGAIKLLLQHLDSPQLIVQDTVRKALAEFNFPRYLSAFDKMSPDAQKNTGRLVRGIDVNTQRLLAAELTSDAAYRRLRALKVIDVMENHIDMEPDLIKAMQHDDYFLRAEAAKLLGHCSSSTAVTALRNAMLDRNVRVRENAEESLRKIAGNKFVPPAIESSSDEDRVKS